MRFFLGPELLRAVPDTCVAIVVAAGVDHHHGVEGVRQRLDASVRRAKERSYGPEVAVWHDRMARLGLDPGKSPPSIETLVKRAKADDAPRVGPVVDLANAISLSYGLPVGAHDLDRLHGDLGVRLARAGEYFTGLGETGVTAVPEGEPVYADDREVRTRGWVWRQGDRGKVTPATRNVLFPIDAFVGVTDERAREAAEELKRAAEELLGAQAQLLWVDRSSPTVTLPISPTPPDELARILNVGFAELYPSREEVERRLRSGPQRIYIGVDPTSPIIHIGHAVGIRKLAQLQKLGHQIILLVGDFTGRIGDPTGKDAARVPLTHDQVLENAQSYKEQVGKILDFDGRNPVELRFNGEWWDRMTSADMIRLAAQFTVQQMIQRDMFQRRLAENKPISLHEFLYPLLQGYDSVALNTDGELGGTDQTFNMLAGRSLMKALQDREKIVFVTGILAGPDGRKMSKSFGNVIGVADPPHEMYARVMSIPDELVMPYFELCTDLDDDALDEVRHELAMGANPMRLKKRLARTITTLYHSAAEAAEAEARFEREVQRRETPEDMPERPVQGGARGVADLLVEAGLAASKGEARRLVQGGAVRVDDRPIRDPRAAVDVRDGAVLRAGKRSFARLRVTP